MLLGLAGGSVGFRDVIKRLFLITFLAEMSQRPVVCGCPALALLFPKVKEFLQCVHTFPPWLRLAGVRKNV